MVIQAIILVVISNFSKFNVHKEVRKMNNISKRVKYIDIAKGITILLTIIGHTISQGFKRQLIFSFHMPLFIVTSGIFYKERTIIDEIKKVFKNLFLPYICWLFIYLMVIYFRGIGQQHDFLGVIVQFLKLVLLSCCSPTPGKLGLDTNNIGGVGSLWFIPMLALLRITFSIIKKITKDNEKMLLYTILLCSFLGYALGIKQYYLPFNYDIALYSLIFYYFGYYYGKHKISDKMNWKEIILIFLIWIIGTNFAWNELVIRRYPMFSIITACSGCLLIFELSKIIEKKFKGKILKWYGENTLNILGCHQLDLVFLGIFSITINSLNSNKTLAKAEMIIIRIVFATIICGIISSIKRIKNKLNKGVN